MHVDIHSYFTLIWLITLSGVVINNKELIRSFICLELSITITEMNFLLADLVLGAAVGHILSLIILSIGAGETAIILGIIAIFSKRFILITLSSFTRG